MPSREQEELSRRLNDDELRKVAAQVEYFVSLLADRYKVEPDEVIEAAKWVREHKEFLRKIKTTGVISILGLLVSSLAMAAWEGVKAMVSRVGN